jgi:hypothetical protein
MSTTNVNNVTNQVTRVTTITNITNITNMTSPAKSPATDEPSECQKLLDVMAKCACCKIHTINRPAIYEPYIEVPYRSDAPDRPSNTIIDIRGVPKLLCECDCRINARMICRSHPDYIPK